MTGLSLIYSFSPFSMLPVKVDSRYACTACRSTLFYLFKKEQKDNEESEHDRYGKYCIYYSIECYVCNTPVILRYFSSNPKDKMKHNTFCV